MGQSKSRSADSFNFAHTSFMLTEPKSWRKVTIGIITALAIVIILLIALVIYLAIARPWENGSSAQRDEKSFGGPFQSTGNQQVSPAGCFPAFSTVITSQGEKPIVQLQIGDMISDIDENGRHTFTEVYAWFRKSNQTGIYLELVTDTDHKIVISRNHLIARYSIKRAKEIVLAKEIVTGDYVFAGKRSWNVSRIVSIRTILAHGLYAPVTMSGTLFVDDIFVSCYTDYWINGLVGHEFIQKVAMAPLRLIYKLIGYSKFVLEPMKNDNLWFVEVWKAVNFVLTKFSI